MLQSQSLVSNIHLDRDRKKNKRFLHPNNVTLCNIFNQEYCATFHQTTAKTFSELDRYISLLKKKRKQTLNRCINLVNEFYRLLAAGITRYLYMYHHFSCMYCNTSGFILYSCINVSTNYTFLNKTFVYKCNHQSTKYSFGQMAHLIVEERTTYILWVSKLF